MIIACVKEIKNNENRVGLTPNSVKDILNTRKGTKVLIEKNAGLGSGFTNLDYVKAGATITTKVNCFKNCDVLVKVKEPIQDEYKYLKYLKNKILYTYLHLAAVDKKLTQELLQNNVTAIAYETIVKNDELVALKPMSEIAGTLAIQYGAQYLQKKYGGLGVTLGNIDNVDPANVVIVGGGTVGRWSALAAAGMGSNVTVLQRKGKTFDELPTFFKNKIGKLANNISIIESNAKNNTKYSKSADLLIGSVLIRGSKAPRLITEQMVKKMQSGAVIVDVAIDQGGCIWGSKATTHDNPIYNKNDKIYCNIANMPGQVSRQSTTALNVQTVPYIIKLIKGVAYKDSGFLRGVQTFNGSITYKAVSESLNMQNKYLDITSILNDR